MPLDDIATLENAKKILEKIDIDDIQTIFNEIVEQDKKFKSEQFIKIKYGQIDNISIYLVDGDYIMEHVYPDFTQGGNGQIYGVKAKQEGKPKFIPENEIWIDYKQSPRELRMTLAHEYFERNLMKNKGAHYEKAHALACKHELKLRKQNPELRPNQIKK